MPSGHRLLVIMGPSGCGKSTIAAALSRAIGVPWLEGDDFHSSANRDKMKSGVALNNTDRRAWIDAILAGVDPRREPIIVLACSALTPYVQQRLDSLADRITVFVFLKASRDQLAQRMAGRQGHFMAPSLLDSQIEALVLPSKAIEIDAGQSVDAIVTQICSDLDLDP